MTAALAKDELDSGVSPATAEALAEYARLLAGPDGPNARKAKDFFASHRHLPLFAELAGESARLELTFRKQPPFWLSRRAVPIAIICAIAVLAGIVFASLTVWRSYQVTSLEEESGKFAEKKKSELEELEKEKKRELAELKKKKNQELVSLKKANDQKLQNVETSYKKEINTWEDKYDLILKMAANQTSPASVDPRRDDAGCGQYQDPEKVFASQKALQHQIGLLKTKDIPNLVAVANQSPDWGLKAVAAIRAIGHESPHEAIQGLQKIAEQSDYPEVKEQAQIAIKIIESQNLAASAIEQ